MCLLSETLRFLLSTGMTKRSADEAPPSMDSSTIGPNFLGCYRDQIAELLFQEESIPHHEDGDTTKPSTEIIGAGISSPKRDKLKALLRQCVKDLLPGVDEVQHSTLFQKSTSGVVVVDASLCTSEEKGINILEFCFADAVACSQHAANVSIEQQKTINLSN